MVKNILEQEHYLPLKEMESFTQDMFNRIIDFQEKKHAAWNPSLAFEQRIKGLPLHYLIFSSADRDPKQFGPTIAHYYPLHHEIIKISRYVHQISKDALLCDYYPGNGFVGSLVAREGIATVGLRNHIEAPNQINEFFDADVYRYSDNDFAHENADAVLVSWPTSEANPTPAIISKQPKLIIYVYTEHNNKENGKRQTGTNDMFDALSESYQLIDHWSVIRQKDLLHEIWPDMTPNIEEHRLVRIYAHRDATTITKIELTDAVTPYDWEYDLHMAELALQAKREIDMQRMMM